MIRIEISRLSLTDLIAELAMVVAVIAIVVFAVGVLVGWALATLRRPAVADASRRRAAVQVGHDRLRFGCGLARQASTGAGRPRSKR